MNKPLTRAKWLEYLDTTWKKSRGEQMNEDIIRMAREAGFDTDLPGFQDGSAIALKLASVAFAAGAAAEREACARVCESEGERIDASWMSCAAAIRARGDQ